MHNLFQVAIEISLAGLSQYFPSSDAMERQSSSDAAGDDHRATFHREIETTPRQQQRSLRFVKCVLHKQVDPMTLDVTLHDGLAR